jgi:hypothetical protein
VACTKDTCTDGVCSHAADQTSCAAASPICDPKLGCIACASNADCDDGNPCTTEVCTEHKCVSSKVCNAKCCCTDSDCQGGVTTQALPGIGLTICPYQVCSTGTCVTKKQTCALLSSCCPYGCCGITTQ